VSLPGADELFRATGPSQPAATATEPVRVEEPTTTEGSGSQPPSAGAGGGASSRSRPRAARLRGERRPSGRERHEEKITVYCSPEELYDLEHARLRLRGEHGLAIDRGRIVREAVAVVLADLEAKGEDSILVRRLRGH
jgi:hypothetical protein